MHISAYKSARFKRRDSLLDRGANGGIAGEDYVIMYRNSDQYIDVTGVDSHQVTNIPTGTIGAYIETDQGGIIGIFHQYGIMGRGHTIHSCIQLESNGNDVDDRSLLSGGSQRIVTRDGQLIPVDIREGLAFIRMRPCTRTEYKTLPHVIMTSDDRWNPTEIDSIISTEKTDSWVRKVQGKGRRTLRRDPEGPFDSWGRYIERVNDGDIEEADEYDVDINNVRISDLNPQDRRGAFEFPSWSNCNEV